MLTSMILQTASVSKSAKKVRAHVRLLVLLLVRACRNVCVCCVECKLSNVLCLSICNPYLPVVIYATVPACTRRPSITPALASPAIS